ncbi:MAG: hypothetical protein ACSW8C_01455 [bacterium]
MVSDKVEYPGFVENRSLRYTLKYVALCLLIGFFGYWSIQKYKQYQHDKLASIPQLLNAPQEKTQLVQIEQDNVRDALDTAEENFIESQIGHEFSKRDNAIFQERRPTINSEDAQFKEDPKQRIQSWLVKQHIQGVAYKDFESCLILNQKVFHLGDLVFPEQALVWSDIDPVEKKLFFSDEKENLYAVNY